MPSTRQLNSNEDLAQRFVDGNNHAGGSLLSLAPDNERAVHVKNGVFLTCTAARDELQPCASFISAPAAFVSHG